MKPLPIIWQRLVSQGTTCPRCEGTGDAVVQAVKQLEASLRPLNMYPVLETQEMDEIAFQLPEGHLRNGSAVHRVAVRVATSVAMRPAELPRSTAEPSRPYPPS